MIPEVLEQDRTKIASRKMVINLFPFLVFNKLSHFIIIIRKRQPQTHRKQMQLRSHGITHIVPLLPQHCHVDQQHLYARQLKQNIWNAQPPKQVKFEHWNHRQFMAMKIISSDWDKNMAALLTINQSNYFLKSVWKINALFLFLFCDSFKKRYLKINYMNNLH